MAAFDNAAQPQPQDVCVINGTPFSGPGVGYNSSTGLINTSQAFPNPLKPGNMHLNISSGSDYGVNTDYTAADYNHPLLAAQKPAPRQRPFHHPLVAPPGTDPVCGRDGRPHQHAAAEPHRSSDLLPEHESQLQSGVKGPWDVNNDGSGTPDSVWVDLGFPVRAAATAGSTSRCSPSSASTSTAG